MKNSNFNTWNVILGILTNKGKRYPCNRLWRSTGLWDFEAPTFLDIGLTDSGEVVSLTRLPYFYSQEDPWYSFLLAAESTPGPYCSWKD
jgi:hypothetical protein